MSVAKKEIAKFERIVTREDFADMACWTKGYVFESDDYEINEDGFGYAIDMENLKVHDGSSIRKI